MDKELEEKFLSELEKNKESLLRICSIYSTDSEMKKDYFQESLLNIYKSLPSFKSKSSLKTWMYKITINVCLGLSKRRIKSKLDFVNIEAIEDQSNSTESVDPRLERLRKCIAKLNTSNKILVSLYLEELPYREIATITGLTENHIAVKLKRIRKKLLNCINQMS